MTRRSSLVVRDEARGRVRWQWLGAMQVDRCPIVVGWHARGRRGGQAFVDASAWGSEGVLRIT